MGNHLIHTQVIEAGFGNKTAALSGQKSLQEIYYQHLIPVMEQVMDEYDQEGKSIRIESLDLDLGRIPKDLPVDLIKQRLQKALEEELRKIYVEQNYLNPSESNSSNSTQKSEKESLESDWTILVYFFQKGTLPWFASSKVDFSISQIFQRILVQHPDRLKSWLSKNPVSLSTAKRIAELARSLDKKTVHQSLLKEAIVENDFKILTNILTELGKITGVSGSESTQALLTLLLFSEFGNSGKLKIFLSEGFKLLIQKNRSKTVSIAEFLIQLLWITTNPSNQSILDKRKFLNSFSKLLKSTPSSSRMDLDKFWTESVKVLLRSSSEKIDLSTIEKLISDQRKQEIPVLKKLNPKEEEKTVIHNAGLVLTAAFLPRFFENLGLVKSGKFISDTAKSQAAVLLQSMMPEQRELEEPDLLLNKLLCGMEPAETIEFNGDLDPKLIPETALLLESMATQWTALKSKSGKMVSEGFFAREGILKKVQRGYHLQIQRLAFDILLDRLPWSIGIIKLPWMEEIISVEW
ncbi:contractile injection system tape measure protein [Algoriphagus halophytocola]|uniref:Contractile injection system tape measure protein n=1 Tax=Algoriphagus halophytocola TaxID=2991499 RepID=A0ABY6MEW4_9BACT|nr:MULTISPECIES: contractile injection system tape measure protein [unclassified Algoriphagus]UZD21703.1 contractile injection system tape measure protein [Algoriphagus sp. TR-M5]WBL42915.1 contractile injection system tape measure protein [Algoriphagus sp. TR-M9]